MSEELKPCPFCGSKKTRIVKKYVREYAPNGANFYHVECGRSRCGAKVSSRKNNRSRAISDWNTRNLTEAIDWDALGDAIKDVIDVNPRYLNECGLMKDGTIETLIQAAKCLQKIKG